MTHPLDFQSIILRLLNYWADQGCLIWQPYHTEVGAGTNNPATYLRVLGPEPWNVAYVEPSIRPDDGRYGENPNRFYQHYQLQVILKPDPGNPQELYLQSLVALGVDPRAHDIRFVEDNWESPALGAWGLGWEVWLDGQEITQFTYFQQAGGQVLDPVAVEITYGLERIAMALTRVRDFRDLPWNQRFTYGDIHLQSEQEFSKYAFEIADVERLRRAYEVFAAEANRALDAGLVLPAHDYVLKCSHTFNLLDTRGAIGVTERQALFGQMRDLSRRVASLYVEQRSHLEYPWLDVTLAEKSTASLSAGELPQQKANSPATFLLEIGIEELPVADLNSALTQLQSGFPALLEELRLTHQGIQIYGTPRRLVVLVSALAPHQTDLEQIVKGPPAERAFDREGTPTRAAEGFARSRGLAVEDLLVKEIEGGRYVAALVRHVGRPTLEVLAENLPQWIASLKFDKSMRWNSSNVSFSRPIRWLLALFGDQVVPFAYANLVSGNTTRGLRFHDPERFEVSSADDYLEKIKKQGIVLDVQERRERIATLVTGLALQAGGRTPDDPVLLDEVTNLVEAPTVLLGEFEHEYLELPREVLVSVMRKHQRYFPVVAATRASATEAELLPYFITVRNGDDYGREQVIQGNADVIRARFADARYFIRKDLRQPLADYVTKLELLSFQRLLGSMLDKTRRITGLVEKLASLLEPDETDLQTARRAAYLCKADLMTSMVVEMTSLQGVMGRYYALASGEPEPVAQAIFEHYLPRSAGDQLPESVGGLLVGIADRLDSLAGLFAVGLAPTGAKDPFAQRRTAQGLVQILIGKQLDFDLKAALRLASGQLPVRPDADQLDACQTFISERLRNWLLEQEYRYDVVDAVLAEQRNNPAGAYRAVKSLTKWVQRPDWHQILPAYARCVRITRDETDLYMVTPEAFVTPEENELCQAIKAARVKITQAGSVDEFLEAFLPMIEPINRFFDAVLVMAEDPVLRANRLGMLQMIAKMTEGVADFSRLEGF
jgi:glycyl-tRNA synthetase